MKEANFQNKITGIIAESKRKKPKTNEVSREEIQSAIAEYQANGGTIKKAKERPFEYDEWLYFHTNKTNQNGLNPGRGGDDV